MAPAPITEETFVTLSCSMSHCSTSAARFSVIAIWVPWGSQKSIINWGRVEFGKKLCSTLPKPTIESTNTATTTPSVIARYRMAPLRSPRNFL